MGKIQASFVSSIVTSAMVSCVFLTTPALAAPLVADKTSPPEAVLSPYALSQAQIDILDTDMPVVDIWEGAKKRSIVEVFGAIDIDASPAQIWEIMTNCDTQLQIVKNMTKCIVKKEDKAEGWDVRVQVLNIGRFLPRVRSKFKSEYTPHREIKVTRTGGDLSVLDGLWTLTPTHDGQTRVTYRARLKPKLPVPRKLMQKATAEDMPKVLKNLRALAESSNQTIAVENAAIDTNHVQKMP